MMNGCLVRSSRYSASKCRCSATGSSWVADGGQARGWSRAGRSLGERPQVRQRAFGESGRQVAALEQPDDRGVGQPITQPQGEIGKVLGLEREAAQGIAPHGVEAGGDQDQV